MVEEAVAQAQNLDDTTRQYYGGVESRLAISVASRYYAGAGNKEKSLDLLEESVRQRIPQILVGQNQPAFDPLRSDPRFIAVRRTMGLEP